MWNPLDSLSTLRRRFWLAAISILLFAIGTGLYQTRAHSKPAAVSAPYRIGLVLDRDTGVPISINQEDARFRL
jgi:hypothetical protein